MENVPNAALERGQADLSIEVADATLTFRPVSVEDSTPTGSRLAAAAGFIAVQQTTVLRFLENGELEDIRPDQTIDLRHGEKRFVIVESDRIYRFTLNSERFDWPCRVISGAVIRKLGHVPDDEVIDQERPDGQMRLIENQDLIDLDAPGVERLVTRKRFWKLNVQGVILDVPTPTIEVRQALKQAGFNPDQGWYIFLKIQGEPKRPVSLEDTVDLRTPGIEKLRLTPKEVINGEAPSAPRRDFDLLEEDEIHLARLGLYWETVTEADGRRWLLIHHYPLPAGYTVSETLLALEVPPTYPGAQIYGFYAYPPLALSSGRTIESTQLRGTIRSNEFHGWSRNRGATPWSPTFDRVATQLALADAALGKELGE